MSSYFTDQRRVYQQVVDFDEASTGNELVFKPTVPIDVMRVRIVLTEATSVAASVVSVGKRAASAAADAALTTTYGTFSLAAGLAANTAYVVEVAGVDSDAVVPTGEHSQVAGVTMGRVDGYQTNLPGVLKVNPGEAFVVNSDGAGTGGAAVVSIEYIEQGDDPERVSVTEITFTRS